MTINGIAVGNGTVPTTGASIGNTTVSNAVSGITGTATIVFSLSGATGTGTFRLDDFTLYGSVTSAGFITTQPGPWTTGATWVGGIAPGPGDSATVAHNVTSATAITRNAGTTTTINSGATLTMTNAYVNNGTTTVNGSFQTGTALGGISINPGSTFLVNGSLQINPNGFIQTGAPVYGSSSTLIYNPGGTYGRGFEWSHTGIGTIGVTPGYPNHVILQNTTTFNYNNGTPLAKAINGNLTIQTGSQFYMDYGLATSGGPLTIGGNLVINGTGILKLGFASGDDLHIGGDITVNSPGVFNGNNRAVFFTKTSGTQTITAPAGITIPYIVFSATGSRTARLGVNTNLTVSAPLGGNAIAFGSASDVIELNNNTLTIGTAGVANAVSGSGTFKGSTTSNLSIYGTGSIGTLNFFSGSQVLGTLTVDRQAAQTAMTLGTPVTINTTLNLTNGLIDVAGNTMTLGALSTVNGASANSFVIAEVSNGGYLRKNMTASGTYNFPVGDGPASANGAQYSPASVVLASAPSGSISVAVEDLKHPNLDASTHYITRYWATAKTGTIPTTYTFNGTYLAADIVGTEAASQSNQWNGTSWTNQGAPVAANLLSITTASFGATNHFTAGLRNADINIWHTAQATNVGSVSYTFPTTVLVGNTASVTFTIQNVGQQTLNMGAATFSGAPFTTTYAAGNVSGPNGSTTFTVTFTPTATGTFSGTLSIPSNDPDENPYIVNFTATGQVPAPEMNVKGLTGGTGSIVDGDMVAVFSNNTLFAATNIGATSAAKDFQIQNLGSATLTLSGAPTVTLGGANPGDFTVTAQPASTSLAASGSTTFLITFTPQAAGIRTAIVSIANNDSDENPYDFMIQGTGNCAATANTVTPLSGPQETEVTITATSNNLNAATATFNGVAAVVTQVSSTQIKVLVPAGATSGYLVTTNSQGCTASTYFTVVDNALGTCEGSAEPARTQLFISEVTDHPSGSHSYVEIYNATGATVNLSGYTVRIHNNGAATATSTITLPSFNLTNGSAYVVAFGGTDAGSNPGGAPNFTSNVGGVNDDDHIRLYNPGGTWIDLWGDTTGVEFTPAPSGYFYRRKSTGITAPSTTWNPNDWTSGTPVNYSNIGIYDFSTGVPPVVTQQPSYSPTCAATSFTVAATEGFVGGNALAYQWYVAAPGSTTWAAVANSGVYTGAATATLNISNVAGLTGYQYYVQVRENGVSCYTASNAVMITDAATSTWNGTTWIPAPPTSGTVAVIAGNYNTASNGSFEACSLTVNGGSSLTIAGNTYVSIESNLTVNSSGTLLILDDGSLVQVLDSGVVTNNGTTQVMRTTSPYNKFDYTYWSSPVAAAAIGATFAGWRTDYAFQFVTANYADLVAPFDGFDDNNNAWVYTPPATVMTKGKGYAIMAPTTGTFPATSTVTFSGAVNNGIVTVPLTLSGNAALTNDDFNLVGNPYPSALFADTFINANPSMAGTLYFWTHRTGISDSNPGPDANNFITDDYAMYNLSGGTSSGTGSPVPSGYVASGQGFFIDAQAATSVVFNNAMRSRLYNNSQFFRPSGLPESVGERDRLWISLGHGGILQSQQLIGFFENSTNGYDRGYDGIVNPSANSVSFYSIIESDRYRIQGRAPFAVSDVIALGYKTAVAGSFTVSIDNIEGVLGDAGLPVYLEDLLLGSMHDLKGGAYTFTTQTGTFDDRFVLRFTDVALSNPDVEMAPSGVIAYAQDGTVFVNAAAPMRQVMVYDLRGRLLSNSGNISGNSYNVDIQASRQPLIVSVVMESGETVSKKILF